MRVPSALCTAGVCVSLLGVAAAQDAVKVDPKHYSVVSENEQVRILKVHYGPHEKSVMHSHPNSVAVFLTDLKVTFTFADGKSEPVAAKAGDSRFTPAMTHLPENSGDKAMEAIVIELKGKSK
jgi:quercetin dioxygenase-like cupin family protein